MLAQLIQALYNIVDSLFVGKYSESGLTALSIIYPLQLLMIAIAVGTGVGINTAMAHYLGVHDEKKQMNMEESEHRLRWHCGCFLQQSVSFYAGICKDVYGFRGSHKGCDCIRPDRLRIQHRIVYRKYLDKDFTGKWGHEDTDDRTDCGGTGQYRA